MAVSSGSSYWPVTRLDKTQTAYAQGKNEKLYRVTDLPEEPLPFVWFLAARLATLSADIHVVLCLVGGPLNSKSLASRQRWVSNFARSRLLTFYLPSEFG